jgi:hypothetical protein
MVDLVCSMPEIMVGNHLILCNISNWDGAVVPLFIPTNFVDINVIEAALEKNPNKKLQYNIT